MTKKEKQKELDGFKLVKHKIGWEGFDYCFKCYSDFKTNITDEKFHQLREGYLNGTVIQSELSQYISEKIDELSK